MAPGTGVSAELTHAFTVSRSLDDALGAGSRGSATRTAIERAASSDVFDWLAHVRSAAGCSNPIRLAGSIDRIDAATGALLGTTSTQDMPDGVIYKSCGNRRETVCPHCAEIYRRDAFQLIRAGVIGGNGIDTHVSHRPAVFVTFTAPSFGLVHGPRHTATGQPAPCRPRRTPDLCPHGVDLRCSRIHAKGEHINGTPLCLDCYDHDGQVVWNHTAGELWRRTIGVALRRYFDRLTRRLGTIAVKPNCCKVAEYQARGVIHYHAVFRLDGIDPDTGDTIDPPAELDVIDLTDAITYAVAGTSFTTEAHPDQPDGWRIGWGKQLDIRPIQLRGDAEITDRLVAGYLAKYLTKSTEATGHVSRRLNSDTIDLYANDEGTHTERLVWAAWWLGRVPEWRKLRRWAHMLGSGGHPLTQSRGYSVTFRILRNKRVIWRRTVDTEPATNTDGETTLIVGNLTYVGTGWHTLGDAKLANTSAALARSRQHAGREDLIHEMHNGG
ncbi:replication initiator [Actinocatenispora comari]|uniref:replication initiator n=1 Tax=Actinocatenispora comari TaxID=2807577 RepID=UPI001CEDA987|nr:replication initiator [Actinocatenispora comari]